MPSPSEDHALTISRPCYAVAFLQRSEIFSMANPPQQSNGLEQEMRVERTVAFVKRQRQFHWMRRSPLTCELYILATG